MSRMLKLWHNWWIVGLANTEINAFGVVALTDSCTVSDLEIPFGSCSRPVSKQSQCVTDKSYGRGTVWDNSLAYALVLYEHLDSWEFL
jgi:hypothetical protein